MPVVDLIEKGDLYLIAQFWRAAWDRGDGTFGKIGGLDGGIVDVPTLEIAQAHLFATFGTERSTSLLSSMTARSLPFSK
jgi:hypothetical protein